jgi:hypothetical protein
MTKTDDTADANSHPRDGLDGPAPYQPPRIVKKRAVSRSTLFSGGVPPPTSGSVGGLVGPVG